MSTILPVEPIVVAFIRSSRRNLVPGGTKTVCQDLMALRTAESVACKDNHPNVTGFILFVEHTTVRSAMQCQRRRRIYEARPLFGASYL